MEKRYKDHEDPDPLNIELLECLELLRGACSNLPDTAYVDYLMQRVDRAIKEAKGVTCEPK